MSLEQSSIKRVLGVSREIEKEIKGQMARRFSEQSGLEMEPGEREKTDIEIQVIYLVNDLSNEVLQRYGLSSFNIPHENIHIFHKEDNVNIVGTFIPAHQVMDLPEESVPIIFAATVLHEMIHFKSYGALQLAKFTYGDMDVEGFADYRMGLTMTTIDNGSQFTYFNSLNEALTEELVKKKIIEARSSSLLLGDMEKTEELRRLNEDSSLLGEEPLFTEDTYYANEEYKESVFQGGGRVMITTKEFSYPNERTSLKLLINRINTLNEGMFKDEEVVFDIFAKAMLTGDILPLGKLIERTFGKGTFRKIGECVTAEELEECIKNL